MDRHIHNISKQVLIDHTRTACLNVFPYLLECLSSLFFPTFCRAPASEGSPLLPDPGILEKGGCAQLPLALRPKPFAACHGVHVTVRT